MYFLPLYRMHSIALRYVSLRLCLCVWKKCCVLCTTTIMLSRICNGITHILGIPLRQLIIFISLHHFICDLLFALCQMFFYSSFFLLFCLELCILLYSMWRNLSKNIIRIHTHIFWMSIVLREREREKENEANDSDKNGKDSKLLHSAHFH